MVIYYHHLNSKKKKLFIAILFYYSPNCGVRSEENGPTLCKTAQCYANKISTVLYFDFYISAFDSSGKMTKIYDQYFFFLIRYDF